jgi:hypothetical protein
VGNFHKPISRGTFALRGRAWTSEAIDRAMMAPKLEPIDSVLVFDDEDRPGPHRPLTAT